MSLEETINKLIKAVENSSRAGMGGPSMSTSIPCGGGIAPDTSVPPGYECADAAPRARWRDGTIKGCRTIRAIGTKGPIKTLSDLLDINCQGCCWV